MKSIKTRFIFFTLVLIILSLVIPVYFLINQFSANFDQRSERMLEATLKLLNYTLENTMIKGDAKDLQQLLDSLASSQGFDHIRIIDTNGIIKYGSAKKELGSEMTTVRDEFNPGTFTSERISLLNNNIYHAFTPIKNKAVCTNCHSGNIIAFLDVGAKLTPAETKFYTGTRHMIFLGIVILLIISAGFYFLFQSFINKPLRKLINAMREVKKGNLSVHLDIERNDEFGTVNKNFNRMVDRLHSSQEEINNLHFEQLQHVDRLITLGELTAETAHEINNHSAIIMSRADYLSLEAQQSHEFSKYSDDIDVILDQIDKVSGITRNVLKHSKRFEKNFEKINLVCVIENTLNRFEPILRKRNIKLIKTIRPDEAFIHGDSLQIEQALTNLIINSLDAMDIGGILDISLASENSHYELKVTDNGCGISDSIKDQVFSPFFTTKNNGKGSGLGLYIVKNICKNHNADILLENSEDAGTSFRIIFNGKGEYEKNIDN